MAESAKSRRAQVWVETVVYMLIGLSIIGLVLAFAMPKINEIKDKAVIEQTITALNEIDSKIMEVGFTAGNTRTVYFKIGRGEIDINGAGDKITFILPDSRYTYSEPGRITYIGDIIAKTEKKGRINSVELMLNYSGRFDIRWQGMEQEKQLFKAPSPYKLLIENNGSETSSGSVIDLREA
ncbi:MAG TPA: type II secretion system protein [Candidatus Nanoarchaeia archaeon]|nr:type II secretion system protein [Candidatus Nanoarchaeia archaeon]